MEKQVTQNRRMYMSEYEVFNGDHYITFNIVDINTERQEITVAVSNEGKISVCSFDLKSDGRRLFFEYGIYREKIAVNDFEIREEQ